MKTLLQPLLLFSLCCAPVGVARSTVVPRTKVKVAGTGEERTFRINQRKPAIKARFTVSNEGADGHVVVDGLQILPLDLAREERASKRPSGYSEIEMAARPVSPGNAMAARVAQSPLPKEASLPKGGEAESRRSDKAVQLNQSGKPMSADVVIYGATPAACSASHVGFCALRLEPIWMALGGAAGHAADMALESNVAVQQVDVEALQKRIWAHGGATIHVSDVPPGHSDFTAVQWWGGLRGFHGLEPAPSKPGSRGKHITSQYFEAFPGHAARLDLRLDDELRKRWTALAKEHRLFVPAESTTRGEWIRDVYTASMKVPEQPSVEEAAQGFESLFDGESFAGWEHNGNWEIQQGAFARVREGGSLTYVKALVPDDFELRFEWKVSKGCNSGVYYRPAQYEYQVLDNVHSPYGENPRQAAGSLFFCMAPSKDATKPVGQWNSGRVKCKGTVIEHWVNGDRVLSFDYTDPKWAEMVKLLKIRGADLDARGGKLWLQDHGHDVWFRKLRWREIPEEEPVTADPNFVPLPVTGEALKKEQERVRRMLGVPNRNP